jgi:putative ABC transport system substrate-binding protein
MNRRTFLCGLTLGALSVPLAAVAQQAAKVWRIGWLNPRAATSPPEVGHKAFQDTLRELGYSAGQSIEIEYRWGEGSADRLRTFAAELVRLRVDAIFAVSSIALRAARDATQTIPIVAIDLETDPVASGMAGSLARPGGNVTGVFLDQPEFYAKWLQLLREVVPASTRVAVLRDPATHPAGLRSLETAAQGLGVKLQVLHVRDAGDLDSAFLAARGGGADGVLVFQSPALAVARTERRIADLAAAHRLPGISMFRTWVDAGGLMSYGVNLSDAMRSATLLLGKIVKGGRPADVPIERPTRFDLVINLKTAKALGLTIPPSLLLRADQVIE